MKSTGVKIPSCFEMFIPVILWWLFLFQRHSKAKFVKKSRLNLFLLCLFQKKALLIKHIFSKKQIRKLMPNWKACNLCYCFLIFYA